MQNNEKTVVNTFKIVGIVVNSFLVNDSSLRGIVTLAPIYFRQKKGQIKQCTTVVNTCKTLVNTYKAL